MQIKSLAQGGIILMLRIELSTFVSKVDIITNTPIVHSSNDISSYDISSIDEDLDDNRSNDDNSKDDSSNENFHDKSSYYGSDNDNNSSDNNLNDDSYDGDISKRDRPNEFHMNLPQIEVKIKVVALSCNECFNMFEIITIVTHNFMTPL